MKLSVLVALTVVNFASYAFAQFSTDITVDSNGKKVYIAAAATSSVAAPASTPTLVYNCYYMPLICENVANFAKDINPGGGGDLGAMQLFYFDPDQSHKESRRTASCGCFKHDDCPLAKSNGKQAGTLVTQIGNQAPMNGLNTPINAASQQILLAGSNPGVLPNTNNAAPRVPLQTVPGRFFQQGVAFTCDEFPAATFINGGSDAKTICALQSWQVFSGSYNSAAPSANKGKWPLVSKSGQRREQDWQAQSHVYLRVSQESPKVGRRDFTKRCYSKPLGSKDRTAWEPCIRSLSPLLQCRQPQKHMLLKLVPLQKLLTNEMVTPRSLLMPLLLRSMSSVMRSLNLKIANFKIVQ